MGFRRNFCFLITGLLASGPAIAAASPAYEKVALPSAQGAQFTTLAIGPDGKLYGAVNNGEIRRWVLGSNGVTGSTEVLSSLRVAEGGDRLLIGLVFDPASTAANPIAWVTHTTYGFSGMADWGGKISRLSGLNLENVQTMVVGLPRSARDHVTNGIAFGPDHVLYFTQGSNSAMGAPDDAWSNRPERLLTAALLRLDPALIISPPLDVKTEEGGTYDPFAPGAPLTLYAWGMRNAYDLVWASNGRLYVPTNGSNSGGNTPAGTIGSSCGQGGPYPGPNIPGLTNVSAQHDYLFRAVKGAYYGHPDPLRCNFVMNGGNPTSGTDPAQVTEYPSGTLPDANYRGFAYDFGVHQSPDGITESRSPFSGLYGKLLCVRYSQGDDIIVLTPGGPNQDIVDAQTGITGFTGFIDPLDLIENPANGYIYVSEYGASKITLLRPIGSVSVPDAPLELSLGLDRNPARTPRIHFTLRGAGDVDLAVFDLSGRRVATLVEGHSPAGTRTVEWSGLDSKGRPAVAGVYFYRLSVGSAAGVLRGVKLE